MTTPYNSFDVFDTLIARRYGTSNTIFSILQSEFNIPHFVKLRESADDGTKSLSEIYQAMSISTVVMRREIELEHQHAIPIQENIDRVQDGDVLISDMYMHPADILSLVRKVGLNKQVSIYQSNSGKSQGAIWRTLNNTKPRLHLGDNLISDISIPTENGFNCEHTSVHTLSHNENYFISLGLPNLAYLMREARLSRPATMQKQFHFAGSQLNLPWLFIFCELIFRTSKKAKVFLGRDGQLPYYIYKSFFEAAYYVPFSRKAAYEDGEVAVEYIKSNSVEDSILIDLCSTGATWEHLNSDLYILVAIYVDHYHYTANRPTLTKGFSYLTTSTACDHQNSIIELINSGDHGRLERIEKMGEKIFRLHFSDVLELPHDLISSIQHPIKTAVSSTSIYKNRIRKELQSLTDDILLNLFTQFIRLISNETFLEQIHPPRAIAESEYYGDVMSRSRAV